MHGDSGFCIEEYRKANNTAWYVTPSGSAGFNDFLGRPLYTMPLYSVRPTQASLFPMSELASRIFGIRIANF